MRARDSLAQRLADLPRRMAEEDRQNQDRVIAEFGGDAAAMADEILRYRRVLKHLAQAVAWAAQGEPFGLIAPGPHLGLSRRLRAAGVPSCASDGEQVDDCRR
jgi:hypothetical protein